MRWTDSGARRTKGFRGYAAAAAGGPSGDGDGSPEDGDGSSSGEAATGDAGDEVYVGSAAAGDVASVDPRAFLRTTSSPLT